MTTEISFEERINLFRSYAKKYNLDQFLETGTCRGDTTAALAGDFLLLFTVELDDALYDAAVQRFTKAGFRSVTCFHGDSGKVLIYIMTIFPRPTLFWLDGHYSGEGTARGAIDTPIVEELTAAVKAPAGSVILIDDARLFGGQPGHTEEFKDYPDIEWVKKMAQENNFAFELKDDIMRLTPNV